MRFKKATIKFYTQPFKYKKDESPTSINIDRNLHIKYSSHIQNIGWQGNKIDGQLSGTSGQGLRLEALKINLLLLLNLLLINVNINF